jgi:hypothetical protein
MLNSGLTLRRPFESELGAYRRFLIANRPLGFSRVFALLNQLQSGKESQLELARTAEQRICSNLGISYVQPSAQFSLNRFRNCEACARSGYHCYLFNASWIKTCPVHHLDLVSSCPNCQHPWPHPYELHRRKCQCCGIDVKFSALAKKRALESPNTWRAMSVMDSVIQNHLGRKDLLALNASTGTEFDMNRIISPNVDDRFWPVLCAPRTARWVKVCRDFGVELTPIVERRFRLKQAPPISLDALRRRAGYSLDYLVSNQLRGKMFRKLKKALNDLGDDAEFEEFHFEQKYGHHIEEGHVGWESLRLWLATTSLEPGQWQFRKSTYFKIPIWRRGPPKRPRLMDRLIHLMDGSPVASGARLEIVSGAMNTYVYQIKLWQTFLVILAISKTFRSMEGPEWRWQTYRDRLPALALPKKYDDEPIHLFLASPRTVCVVAPRFLADFSKESIACALWPLFDKRT